MRSIPLTGKRKKGHRRGPRRQTAGLRSVGCAREALIPVAFHPGSLRRQFAPAKKVAARRSSCSAKFSTAGGDATDRPVRGNCRGRLAHNRMIRRHSARTRRWRRNPNCSDCSWPHVAHGPDPARRWGRFGCCIPGKPASCSDRDIACTTLPRFERNYLVFRHPAFWGHRAPCMRRAGSPAQKRSFFCRSCSTSRSEAFMIPGRR